HLGVERGFECRAALGCKVRTDAFISRAHRWAIFDRAQVVITDGHGNDGRGGCLGELCPFTVRLRVMREPAADTTGSERSGHQKKTRFFDDHGSSSSLVRTPPGATRRAAMCDRGGACFVPPRESATKAAIPQYSRQQRAVSDLHSSHDRHIREGGAHAGGFLLEFMTF